MTELLGKARRAYQAGRFEEAVALFKQLTLDDKHRVTALRGVAGTLLELERYEEAISACNDGLALEPDNAYLHLFLGIIYSRKGNFQASDKELTHAFEIDSYSSDMYIYLGVELMRKEKLEQAREALQRAIQLNPDSSLALWNLAIVYGRQKCRHEAAMAARQAFRLEPSRRTLRGVVQSFNDEYPFALAVVFMTFSLLFIITGIPFLFSLLIVIVALGMALNLFHMGERVYTALYLLVALFNIILWFINFS